MIDDDFPVRDEALEAKIEYSPEGWNNGGSIFHYRLRIEELKATLWFDSKEDVTRFIRDKRFP